MGIKQRLRPYQLEAAHAILKSVLRNRGLTITVEVARQGGKNELSAQLELLLLTLNRSSGGNLVKAAPTYMPQLLNSIFRLKDRLNDAGHKGLWTAEGRNSFRVGKARQVFLSAEPSARVVGATAHVLLEMDEAQEIDKTKYYKEFRPMGASTNVTTVLYGTPWDGESLLEEQKQLNLELERRDGVRRHFRYDWQDVAVHNPLYREYVESERLRLGEDHPMFRSQYLLLPVRGQGGLLGASQQAQLQGGHSRRRWPEHGKTYVAALDMAGGVAGSDALGVDSSSGSGNKRPQRDSTVLTIAELDFDAGDPFSGEPQVKVVEHMQWTGVSLAAGLSPTGRRAEAGLGLPARGGRRHRPGTGTSQLPGASPGQGRRRSIRVHRAEQVAPGLRPVGGGEQRSSQDVRPGRFAGVRGVLGAAGTGRGLLSTQPHDELPR